MAVYGFSDDVLVVRNLDSAGLVAAISLFLTPIGGRHNIRFGMGGRDSELKGRESLAL